MQVSTSSPVILSQITAQPPPALHVFPLFFYFFPLAFAVVLKHINKFSDIPSFERWRLISLLLSMGFTEWLTFNKDKEAEVMEYCF